MDKDKIVKTCLFAVVYSLVYSLLSFLFDKGIDIKMLLSTALTATLVYYFFTSDLKTQTKKERK